MPSQVSRLVVKGTDPMFSSPSYRGTYFMTLLYIDHAVGEDGKDALLERGRTGVWTVSLPAGW
jgi:hypothetical protein